MSCSFIGQSAFYTPCEAVYPASTHGTSTTYACSAQLCKLYDKSMNPFVFRPLTGSSGIACDFRSMARF